MSDLTTTLIGFVLLIVTIFLLRKKFKSDDKKDRLSFDTIKTKYPNVSQAHKENTHSYNILWMLFKRDHVELLDSYSHIGMFWRTGEPWNHHEVGCDSLEELITKRVNMPLQHLIINGKSVGFHVVQPVPYIVIDEINTTKEI